MTDCAKRKDKDHLSAERAAQRAARQARCEKALEYRRLGLTCDAIGKLLGVSRPAEARRLIRVAPVDAPRPPCENRRS